MTETDFEPVPPKETETKPNRSLVVSMYNSKPDTIETIEKFFIPSLLRNLNTKTQLVIVDDGSPLYEETSKMIQTFEADLKSKAGDVVFKRLPNNKGFAGAYNEGLRIADGNLLMIANDDLYLPKGSVESLFTVSKLDPQTGLVGPVIDNAWSYQGITLFSRIKDLSPEELKRIEDFSVWLRKVMDGERYKIKGPRKNLNGSCLVFKKEVLQDAGYLDERFEHGFFEDTDWAHRVGLAGYDLVVDAATFVEHGGPKGQSQSFKQNPEKQSQAFNLNALKYAKKWGLGTLPFLLAKEGLQSHGIMSIQGEIVRKAKEKGLWKKH